ncbi:hypothetical protein K7I13_06015 [Brucepastera parasyntrophica]|uniref:WD40/YVTN/BNR-like repeat-containing protein n=1 Tax=Brucepastera parasyntrophica TaxID=2880008 RepID=UPI0021090AC2|nr:hypothetical protein [Brucepastera parasyntrophica]ULQ60819.1 hypothetical protein K7I13_06015 [Brucepastera parasyntrophica]
MGKKIEITFYFSADVVTVIPSACVLTRSACNDALQHVEDSVAIKIPYDADLFAQITSHEEFAAVVKEDDVIQFTGTISADTSWEDMGNPYPIGDISLTIKDYTSLFSVNTESERVFLNTALTDILTALCDDLHIQIVTDNIPAVILPVFVMAEGTQYLQTIDALCYQYQIAFSFDNLGRCQFFNFGEMPSVPDTIDASTILSKVQVKKSKKKYDAVKIGYNTLSTKENEQVYFESFGYDSNNAPTPVVIQPGVYYPFDASPVIEETEGQVYQSFASGYAETIRKYNGELDYRRSKNTTLLYTRNHYVVEDWEGSLIINRTEFGAQRASVRFLNNGTVDARLRQFAIRADVIYRNEIGYVSAGSGKTDRLFSSDVEFIYTADHAEALARTLYRYVSKGNFSITFSTDNQEIEPGTFVHLDMGLSGFIVDVLILLSTVDAATGIYTYKAISVRAAAVDVSRFKLTQTDDSKGEKGDNGNDGQSLSVLFAKNTSLTTPPSYTADADNPGAAWTIEPPALNEGEYLWQITSRWQGEDRLTAWSPVRLSGPKGDDGATGATGPQGAPAAKYLYTGYATAGTNPIVTIIKNDTITQVTANTNDFFLCTSGAGAGHTIGSLYQWNGSVWAITTDTDKAMVSAADALELSRANPETDIQAASIFLGKWFLFQKTVSSIPRSVPQAGDQLIYMGLDPRKEDPLNYEFAIKELVSKNGSIESWLTHFITERVKEAFNIVVTGGVYASRGFYAGNVYDWQELMSNPGSDPAASITGLNPYAYIETGTMLIPYRGGEITSQAHYTNDGVYFNPIMKNGSPLTILDITYGDGAIVCALAGAGLLRITTDEGASWSEVYGLPSSVFIGKVAFDGGHFVCLPAAFSTSSLVGYTTADSILTWSQNGNNGGAYAAKFLCGGNGIFLAFAADGRIWICTDRKNFTYLRTINKSILSAQFYDGKFLLACGDGCFYTTTGSDLVDVTPRAGLSYIFFSGNDGVYCAGTSNVYTDSGFVFCTEILARSSWTYSFDLLDYNKNVVGNSVTRVISCVARSRLFKKTIAFLSGQGISDYNYITYEAKYQNIADYSGVWVPFDMVIEAVTTNPTKGGVVESNAQKRLVGKELSLVYNYKQSSSGAAGSGDYLLKLPDNLRIDTRIHPINALVGVGYLSTNANETGSNTRIAHARVYNNQYLKISYNIADSSSGAMYYWGSGRYQLSTANITMRMKATLTVL